jgi:hypothetical protein
MSSPFLLRLDNGRQTDTVPQTSGIWAPLFWTRRPHMRDSCHSTVLRAGLEPRQKVIIYEGILPDVSVKLIAVNSCAVRYICLEGNLPIIPSVWAEKLCGGAARWAVQGTAIRHSTTMPRTRARNKKHDLSHCRLGNESPFRKTQHFLHFRSSFSQILI